MAADMWNFTSCFESENLNERKSTQSKTSVASFQLKKHEVEGGSYALISNWENLKPLLLTSQIRKSGHKTSGERLTCNCARRR
jgi:hypothetical protein